MGLSPPPVGSALAHSVKAELKCRTPSRVMEPRSVENLHVRCQRCPVSSGRRDQEVPLWLLLTVVVLRGSWHGPAGWLTPCYV